LTNNTTQTFVFRASGTSTSIGVTLSGSAGDTAEFTLLSVKELAGNHAYQTSSAARPALRNRYNLLTFSEEFDNAAWTLPGSPNQYTVTANAEIAPDGTTTADKLTPPAALSSGHIRQETTGNPREVIRSCYAKSAGYDYLIIQNDNAAGNAVFNLSNGTVVTAGAGITATITPVGNGWYRCVAVYGAASGGAGNRMALGISPDGVVVSVYTSWTGDGTSGIYIWGAQLIVTNSLASNEYQRIAAAPTVGSAPTYDTDTTKFPPYLQFVTDDAMLTNSINFTATDKMTVWAGVRKLSDAAAGIAAELSANWSTNNGTFSLQTPNNTSGNLASFSKGDALFGATQGTLPTGFAAPISTILSSSHDISGDLTTLKVNGVAQASATGDKGAGNFGNYPLYIGQRFNAPPGTPSTFFLNGYIYGLIIRGAQTDPIEIQRTEAYLAAKMQVTL
jgi:hypothetical protein